MAYFKFANKIRRGEAIQIYNHGDMYRDFTYVDDIVTGIEHMLCNPPKKNELGDAYKIYNIGNHKPEQLMHFIEVLEKAWAKRQKKNICPCSLVMYKTYADVSELRLRFRRKRRLKKGWGAQWYKAYYSINHYFYDEVLSCLIDAAGYKTVSNFSSMISMKSIRLMKRKDDECRWQIRLGHGF